MRQEWPYCDGTNESGRPPRRGHWQLESWAVLTLAFLFACPPIRAGTVRVRHTEGLVHGFLVLRDMTGKALAEGDLIQTAQGDHVTSRLTFHFKDGSLHDETVVFSQNGTFRLLTDHQVQKGPAFPHPVDVSIDASKGSVTVHYRDDDGQDKDTSDQLDLPADLANGMVLTILKNIQPETPETQLYMVAVTPKPRLVRLAITPMGEEAFSVSQSRRKAMRYAVNVEIGGIKGWFAHLLGKQPPPVYVWILGGEAPAFVRSEGPLFVGGPIWRIELTSPVWPKGTENEKKE
jgi:hypothetical protein